jgi:hypothetical protein
MRMRFLRALRAADETELYVKLGYPTALEYAKDQFKWEKSQAHEFIRIARKLTKLPLMARSFEEGKISWSAFQEMSRAARKKREEEWIAFAQNHSLAEIRDEVRRAITENRHGAFPPRSPGGDGGAP